MPRFAGQRRRRSIAALAAVGLMAATTCSTAASYERQHYDPLHADLSLPASVEARQPVSFSYRLANLPAPDRLYLQQPVGTAHDWRDLERLTPSTHGTGQTAGLPMGTFRYRLAISEHGQTIWTGRPVSVRAYANLPLERLLPGARPGSTVIGSNTFNYVWVVSGEDIESGKPMQQFGATATACRSVHVEVAVPSQHDLPNRSWLATVSQQTQAATTTRANENEVASLSTALIPGQSWSFGVTFEETPHENGGASPVLFINGYANCYRATPLV